MKKRWLLLYLVCAVGGVLLGAAIGNRFQILRGYLASDMDGNGYAITNLGGLKIGTNDVAVTNIVDAQIAPAAAIAKSKISTNSTWAVADIPTLPETQITGLTADLAAKVNRSDDTATNLSLAGGKVTTTNLTWNTETLTPSAATNFVVDFLAPRTALITATNDVNWLNSTNRTATTATERSKKVRIVASGANRLVTLHASWLLVGSTSRTMTITNGTWAVLALDNAGASETNVFVGMTYAQ